VSNPEDSNFDFSESETEPDFGFEFDSLADSGTSEAEELFVSEIAAEDVEETVPVEPAATDKKSKKGKKEKAPKVKKEKAPKEKKEKAPKVKKEKTPKPPREKMPWDASAAISLGGIILMALIFAAVNAHVIMKYGVSSAILFLAIFDSLALVALAISFFLRSARNKSTESDFALGLGAISLVFACMFLLCNIAIN
jgi:Periplasmic protein TonB, links inner and outer membranes